MKTLVDTDESVLKRAMRASGAATKRETIMVALDALIKAKTRERIKGLSGSGILSLTLPDLAKIRSRRNKTHDKLARG